MSWCLLRSLRVVVCSYVYDTQDSLLSEWVRTGMDHWTEMVYLPKIHSLTFIKIAVPSQLSSKASKGKGLILASAE